MLKISPQSASMGRGATLRTICRASAEPQHKASQSWAGGLVAALQCWFVAYLTWRKEREAIVQLSSMSDRELKDIGLSRSEIAGAADGEGVRDCAISRYY